MDDQIGRWRIILSRYLDILFLAGAAIFLYMVLRVSLEPYLEKLIKVMERLPGWGLWSVNFSIFFGFWLLIIRHGGSIIKGLSPRVILKYPPFWFACLPSMVLIWFVDQWICHALYNKSSSQEPGAATMVFFAAIAGVIVATAWHEVNGWLMSAVKQQSRKPDKQILEHISDDPEMLLRWIETETPITTPLEDLLDTDIVAYRIAGVLKEPPLQSVALVGSFGSGKSSIINMVDHHLKHPLESRAEGGDRQTKDTVRKVCPIILVRISGWGLQKGNAAEHILNDVVKECGRYVDCSMLSGLPSQYSASMGTVGWGKAAASFLSRTPDPMDLLNMLDRILFVINKRLVVFVEDLDRNWQRNNFWTEVVSLFDRLKKLSNASFVLAITDAKGTGEAIRRVADHIENIPTLSAEKVAKIYRNNRRLCLARHDDIEFLSETERDQRVGITISNEQKDIDDLLGFRRDGQIVAIAALIATPRNLKHILRRTNRAWQSLHGEIDFDDLFVANIFRVARPEVFNFINHNIRDIWWLWKEATNQNDTQRERLHTKLAQIVSGGPSDIEAINKNIEFLFPCWKDSSSLNEELQGVSRPAPTDYWDRLIREKLVDNDISDQEVVRAINAWKENMNQAVYRGLDLATAFLRVPGFKDKIKQFENFLDRQQVRILTSQVFEIKIQSESSMADGSTVEKELRELAVEKPYSGHGDWLIQEIKKLIPASLSAAVELYIFWFDPVLQTSSEETKRVRDAVLGDIKFSYSDIAVFANSIRFANMGAVRDLINTFLAAQYGGSGSFNHEEWIWLADLLLTAAKANATLVIQQIVGLAIQQDFIRGDRAPSWNQDRIKTIFQDKERDVMKLLIQCDISFFDEKKQAKIAFARAKAIEWLEKNPEVIDKEHTAEDSAETASPDPALK